MAFDDWIIGSGPDEEDEFIVHVAEPWFVARYADLEELAGDYDPSGLTVSTDDGAFFYDFRWQAEPKLSKEEIIKLCNEAAAALGLIDDIEDDDRQRRLDQN